MSLDFDSIVYIANQLKQEKFAKGLPDSEIMALYCIWFRLSYSDFIQNQEKYLNEYSYLYANPYSLKRESTLPPCTHRVLQLFRHKYSLPNIKKNRFKREILELYNSPGSIVHKNFTKILKDYVKPNSIELETRLKFDFKANNIGNENSNKNFKNEIYNNQLIGRQEDYINFLELLDQNQIITLSGFYGVGKTSFLLNLKEILEDKYRYFYTDFSSIDTFDEWAIKVLSWSNIENQVESLSLFKNLLDFFETRNSLVVIDSVGKFNSKFNSFIESLALKNSSNSKLIISSSYKLNIPKDYVAHYDLLGLMKKEDIFAYMNSLGLKDEDSWEELSQRYIGNFREISYVAKFIRDFFNGSVSEYLKVDTNIISSDLYSTFSKINFIETDYKIFSAFSKANNGLSKNMLNLLRGEASSAEIFLRIQFLCDQGYLISSKNEQQGFVYYSLFPLFRNFLIQEKLINA